MVYLSNFDFAISVKFAPSSSGSAPLRPKPRRTPAREGLFLLPHDTMGFFGKRGASSTRDAVPTNGASSSEHERGSGALATQMPPREPVPSVSPGAARSTLGAARAALSFSKKEKNRGSGRNSDRSASPAGMRAGSKAQQFAVVPAGKQKAASAPDPADTRPNPRGYARGLGLVPAPKWTLPADNGISSDRTHGIRGRPRRDAYTKVGSEKQQGTSSHVQDDVKAALVAQAKLELERPAVPPAPEWERPHFSGIWKCVSVEGDWDAYLALLGVPILKRRMAFGTGYGKGRALQKIDQEGSSSITVTSAVVQSSYRETFRVLKRAGRPTPNDADNADLPPPSPLPTQVQTRIDGNMQSLAPQVGDSSWEPNLSAVVAWEGKAIVTRTVTGPDRQPTVIKRIWIDPPGQAEGEPEWRWGQPTMVTRVIGPGFIASRSFQLVDSDGDPA